MPTRPPTFRPRGVRTAAEHKSDHDARRSAEEPWRRWYGLSRWKRIRASQLQREPLCAMHQQRGELMPARICDHVEPHHGDENKFWNGPFQSLCEHCHNSLKQRAERRR